MVTRPACSGSHCALPPGHPPRGAIVGRLQAHKLPALRVDDNAEELTGLLPALADKNQLRLKARQICVASRVRASGNASSTMLALTPISSRTSIIP